MCAIRATLEAGSGIVLTLCKGSAKEKTGRRGLPAQRLPGAAVLRDASSSTRIQSPSPTGVNCLLPVVGNSPAASAAPVRGLYHQALAAAPAILVMSTVSARAVGRYAITVPPSGVRAAAR